MTSADSRPLCNFLSLTLSLLFDYNNQVFNPICRQDLTLTYLRRSMYPVVLTISIIIALDVPVLGYAQESGNVTEFPVTWSR